MRLVTPTKPIKIVRGKGDTAEEFKVVAPYREYENSADIINAMGSEDKLVSAFNYLSRKDSAAATKAYANSKKMKNVSADELPQKLADFRSEFIPSDGRSDVSKAESAELGQLVLQAVQRGEILDQAAIDKLIAQARGGE